MHIHAFNGLFIGAWCCCSAGAISQWFTQCPAGVPCVYMYGASGSWYGVWRLSRYYELLTIVLM